VLQARPAIEFLDFRKRIDAEMPESLDVHLVTHNYALRRRRGSKPECRAVRVSDLRYER